jgi:DNA-binding winged helix-turn-helix (wHTH) protein
MLQAASNSLGDVAAQLVEAACCAVQGDDQLATLRELTMAENEPPSSDPEAPTGGPESALPEGTSEVILFGPYVLIANLRRLERDGLPVPLDERSFDILCVLIERAGEVVTHRELMTRVFRTAAGEEESVLFHINALCKALAQDGAESRYIRKVGRRGYTFAAPARSIGRTGEGNWQLWDGHIIIDAIFPLV